MTKAERGELASQNHLQMIFPCTKSRTVASISLKFLTLLGGCCHCNSRNSLSLQEKKNHH